MSSDSSYKTQIRKSQTLIKCCAGPQGIQGIQGTIGVTGPTGPAGPGSFTPVYASIISTTTQNAGTTNPVAITYNSKTIGNIDLSGGIYPGSQIKIPVAGVYRILFSAQCNSTSGTHYLQIFPVVNSTTVASSNTRLRLPQSTESCLTVEYFLQFNQNDILEFYVHGDDSRAQLIYYPGDNTHTPIIPETPSIIVTLARIA